MKRSGFTLIELLVVILIIVILIVVTILILDPYQYVLQTQDAQRLSDLEALNGAIDLFHGSGGLSLGSSSIIYISIPDPAATSTAGDQCQGLVGLPTLPSIDTYHCAATSTYRRTDGTGWVPINFNSVPGINLLNTLPVDPVNTTSSRDYYSYAAANGQWDLTEAMAASVDQLGGANDQVSTDNGHLDSLHELGTNLNLEPLDYGNPALIGYWPFNEGSGSMAYDESGSGNNGTISGATWVTSGCSSGASSCLSFNGTSAYIAIPTDVLQQPWSLCAWMWVPTQPYNGLTIINDLYTTLQVSPQTGEYTITLENFPAGGTSAGAGPLNSWQYVCGTISASGSVNLYANGAHVYSYAAGTPQGTHSSYIGAAAQSGGGFSYYFDGLMDDIRLYNSALSASQIQILYNTGG